MLEGTFGRDLANITCFSHRRSTKETDPADSTDIADTLYTSAANMRINGAYL